MFLGGRKFARGEKSLNVTTTAACSGCSNRSEKRISSSILEDIQGSGGMSGATLT